MMQRVNNHTKVVIIGLKNHGRAFEKCLSCFKPLLDNIYMCNECWREATNSEQVNAKEALSQCYRDGLIVEITSSQPKGKFNLRPQIVLSGGN